MLFIAKYSDLIYFPENTNMSTPMIFCAPIKVISEILEEEHKVYEPVSSPNVKPCEDKAGEDRQSIKNVSDVSMFVEDRNTSLKIETPCEKDIPAIKDIFKLIENDEAEKDCSVAIEDTNRGQLI